VNDPVAAVPGERPAAGGQRIKGQPERAGFADWLAVIAGTLGAFMALLDVSVVNAALPVIQGEIGATQAEGTWVSTSYLVAEIVVIPLTAWLERVVGLRRMLLFGAVLFTLFSVVCGLSGSLTMMIVGRVGQGLAGGTMIPAGMTIMAKRLPPSQQSIGMAAFAASALMGPILGPLLGGWMTDNYSWHYAFFINVPICAGLVALILLGFPPERIDPADRAEADWLGIVGMVLGLGALTIVLEEGHREQWFESALIWQLTTIGAVGFALIALGQIRAREPVLKLSLMRDRALSAAMLLMAVNGAILFSTLFTVPQFLAAIAGYTAFQAGMVLLVAGVVSIFGAVVYPLVIALFDLRAIVGLAFLTAALASWYASRVTVLSDGAHFTVGLIILGIGVTFTAIPLQQAAISSVPVEDSGHATSMFNVARNVGAAVGLAALASFFDRRIELHHWRIAETIAANDPALPDRLGAAGGGFAQGPDALDAGVRMVDGMVMKQAMTMAFGDIFLVLAVASVLCAPLVLLLRPIDPERAKGMMH